MKFNNDTILKHRQRRDLTKSYLKKFVTKWDKNLSKKIL